MISTIIAIIIALMAETTPAQPTDQNPTTPATETEGESNPSAERAFGGTGQWVEG